MTKPKGSKFKKQKNKGGDKKRPRGGGHGFTKTKELKEFEGSIPKSTPVRSILQQRHFGSAEEEGNEYNHFILYSLLTKVYISLYCI